MNDYYNVLGIKKTASQADIKQAYLKLAKKYHPDTSTELNAVNKFQEISNAYDTLKNATKRQEYDVPPSMNSHSFDWGRASGGSSFNDIFNDIFNQQRRQPQKNSDIQFQYIISLEESYSGVERNVNVKYPGGESKDLKFKIPPGTVSNTRLRLSGQGPLTNPSLPAGDVYIIISVSRHSKFICNGMDLITTQEISSIDAMLGCTIAITTLNSKTLNIKIPEGTQSHSKIRIRGKGMPIYGTTAFGDLYLDIILITPTNLTTEQREILINLKKTLKNT